MKRTFLILSSAITLAACGTLNNEQQGALLGGIAGGILGNQIGGGSGQAIATVIGASLGMAVGGNIGRRMDASDRARVANVLETSPSGRTIAWTNPDTQHRYEVTPRPAVMGSNTICREYTTVGYIGGKREEIVGVACRQADGSWKAQ